MSKDATVTEDKKPRVQDPIRAAASEVAKALGNRDRVQRRIERLSADLAKAEAELPAAEEALAGAKNALSGVMGRG